MEYRIEGGQLPVIICDVNAGEEMITQKGAMTWMSPNMKMTTQGTGGIGKSLGRMFAGDSIFQNVYKAQDGPGQIAFASCFPGSIKVIDVGLEEIIVQKSSFLASESTVELSVFFKKKLGAGLFGGEGFIMQKMSGSGRAFIELDGYVVERELASGEQIVVDSGNLAYMSGTCNMDIVMIKGAKNIVFGGEGLFNTVVTGPGKVGLQTMPITSMAAALGPYVATGN